MSKNRFPEDPNAHGVVPSVRLDPHAPTTPASIPAIPPDMMSAVNTALLSLELAQRLAKLPKHGEIDPRDGLALLIDASEDTLQDYNALVDAARFLLDPQK